MELQEKKNPLECELTTEKWSLYNFIKARTLNGEKTTVRDVCEQFPELYHLNDKESNFTNCPNLYKDIDLLNEHWQIEKIIVKDNNNFHLATEEEAKTYDLNEVYIEETDPFLKHDLMKKLDAIVAMKTIPDEKQRSLLSEVSHILRDAQIMTKLNYLKILIRRRTNIGLYLLDLLDNPDFIAKIHDEAENQLRNSIRAKRLNGVDDSEIVFISLVLIAMLEYDGNFFFNVHKTYSRLYKLCRVEQTVDGLIRTIIDKYRNSTSKLTSNSRKISLILSNSIVPYYYLGAFFEFIFDIYFIIFAFLVFSSFLWNYSFL